MLGESDWSLIFRAISSSYTSKPRRTFALSSLKSEFESKRRFTRLFSVEQFDNPIVETKCIVLCYISLPISEQRGKNFKLFPQFSMAAMMTHANVLIRFLKLEYFRYLAFEWTFVNSKLFLVTSLNWIQPLELPRALFPLIFSCISPCYRSVHTSVCC